TRRSPLPGYTPPAGRCATFACCAPRLASVKRDAVGRWEADVREPGWSNVAALAQALGVDCTALLQPPAELHAQKRGRPPKPHAEPAEEPAPKRPRGRRGRRSERLGDFCCTGPGGAVS